MIFALLAMDLVWATGLAALSIAGMWAALAAYARTNQMLGAPAAIVLSAATFLVVYGSIACAVTALLPRAREGRYPLLRGRDFYLWSVGLIARRWLDIPPISTLIRQSALARLVMLRAAGASVDLRANMSSDVVILDPHMLTLGNGSMLGSGVMVSGHMVVDGVLTLASVVIHEGAELGADARVGPGVTIGSRARVQSGAVISPYVTIGDDVVIGVRAVIGARATIGDRARVAPNATLPNGTNVPADASFP